MVPGSITTLLSPSGSNSKTTVLRLIAGLETPDGGTIRDPRRRPYAYGRCSERGIGFVFQGYALFSHLSVRDNIAFGLRLGGKSRAEIDAARRRAHHARAARQASEARKPEQRSGGQKPARRVSRVRSRIEAQGAAPRRALSAFASTRACASNCASSCASCTRVTPVTTLLVTHDQDEALELSDHIVLMHDGRVVQMGTPHELYDHPATLPSSRPSSDNASVLRGHVEGWTCHARHRVRCPLPTEGAKDGAAGLGLRAPERRAHHPPRSRTHRAISLALIYVAYPRRRLTYKVAPAPPADGGEHDGAAAARGGRGAASSRPGERVLVDLGTAKTVEDYSI